MSNPTYDIFFSGKMIEGHDPDTVRNNLERLLNIDSERLARLFAGKPVRIKGGVDQETAIKYRTTFREAGALIDIRAVQVKKSTSQAQEKVEDPETTGMTLLPPKTGSLIDYAPEVEPAIIPDISNITLAPTGTTIDETEPPPPLIIDTHELSLAPVGTAAESEQRLIHPKPAM